MQSTQEETIERFMRDSFGAQNLFVPKKTHRNKEPVDLFWYSDGLLILFFLQASRHGPGKQVQHNLKQAAGFRRQWGKGMSTDALRGQNRFGDECLVPFGAVKRLINVSVISSRSGVIFHGRTKGQLSEISLSIPDLLIQWTAEVGGTVVDLIQVILKVAVAKPPRQVLSERVDMDRLTNEWTRHAAAIYRMPSQHKAVLSGIAGQDRMAVSQFIGHMRMPSTAGSAMESKEDRQIVSRIFADMSAKDFFHVSALAALTIQQTEPPLYKYSLIGKTVGLHHNFVVAALNVQSSGTFEAKGNEAVSIASDSDGIQRDVVVIYGHTVDGFDYRSPMLILLPKVRPTPQAHVTFDSLLSRLLQFNLPGNAQVLKEA
jgi:hypothetical protein